MNDNILSETLYDLDTLEILATEIASKLKRGHKIGLIGPLGSGKTTFVQFIFNALGGNSHYLVTSPTFNLVNEYLTPKGPLIHVDLYRLQSIKDWDALDLESEISDKITIVEWADKFLELKSYFNLILSFDYEDKSHLRKIKVLRNNVV